MLNNMPQLSQTLVCTFTVAFKEDFVKNRKYKEPEVGYGNRIRAPCLYGSLDNFPSPLLGGAWLVTFSLLSVVSLPNATLSQCPLQHNMHTRSFQVHTNHLVQIKVLSFILPNSAKHTLTH